MTRFQCVGNVDSVGVFWYNKKKGETMKSLTNLQGKRVCVACSGGVDSTALLHYMLSLQETLGISVSAVHCEHGLRGEASVADMHFVQALCEKWKVKLFIFRADCRALATAEKCSEETAARTFRMQSFAKLIAQNEADYIATAHHEKDEAETVLFRLARGSGLGGAAGMQAVNGYLVRPFLSWTRKDIEEYAQLHHLAYCVDETNFSLCATRNELRHVVLPALEKAVPGASGALARFAMLAAEDDAYLQQLSETLIQETDNGYCVAFCDTLPLFRRACLKVMKALGVEKDYTLAHVQALCALQQNQRGAKTHLPKGVIAEKTLDGIAFCVGKSPMETVDLPEPIAFTENGFDGGRYAVKCCFAPPVSENTVGKVLKIDADKLPQDAVFRFRRDGDEITKYGGGTKSLKKLFNEKKTAVEERAYIPLIASKSGNQVYAVCGMEIADRIKVDETTRRVLYIVLQKK